jgi:hypothetical protein
MATEYTMRATVRLQVPVLVGVGLLEVLLAEFGAVGGGGRDAEHIISTRLSKRRRRCGQSDNR